MTQQTAVLSLVNYQKSSLPWGISRLVIGQYPFKNIPGLQGYFTETEHNKFYSVSLNDEQFILVNYDKVMQFFTPYCTDPEAYEIFMKLLIAHSDLSYCHFAANEEQNILLPDDNDYYDQYED